MRESRFGTGVIVGLAAVALMLAVAGPRLLGRGSHTGAGAVLSPAVQTVTAKGVFESEDQIELGSQIDGRVKSVLVEEGDLVRKGDLLVRFGSETVVARVRQAEGELARAEAKLRELQAGFRPEDRQQAQSALDRAQAVLTQARDEHERHKRLYRANATTLVELQRAEERYKVAENDVLGAKAVLEKMQNGSRVEEVEQARGVSRSASSELAYAKARLRDYEIYAPMDGLVARRLRDPGETVKEGTVVLKLINLARMRVRAELEETDAGKVSVGQAAEVISDAYPGKVFRGQVVKVLPVVQRKSQKTFDPMASLDINTQEIHVHAVGGVDLKDGMSVTVRFKK